MRYWVWAAGALLAPCVAHAQVSVFSDGYGYSRAVMTAELGTLQKMSKAPGAAGKLGGAGYYRVRGELENANRAARACLEAVVASPPETVKGMAFLCEATLAGNALIEGDIAGWARHMQQVRSAYAQTIKPMLKSEAEIADIARPRLERFVDWPRSAWPVAPRGADVDVPIQPSNELASLTATVKGGDGQAQSLTFLLDTGAARSHLSRSAAKALGLAVTEDFVVVDDAPGKVRMAGLVAPADLVLNGVTVREVSFNSEEGREVNLIGLDVLRALGRVRISRQSLTLLAAQTPVDCKRRMATTSSLWGPFFQQRYPIRSGEKNQLMLVDTGFNGAFQMRGAPRSAVPAASIRRKNVITTGGAEDIEYAEASTPVMINDKVLNIPVDVAFQAPDLFASSWRIGYGVTARYDLYMDMQSTYGCLIERPVEPSLLPAPTPRAAAAGQARS
jgi:predicted aspartyl protease